MNPSTTEKKTKEISGPLYKHIADTLREEIRTRYGHNDTLPTQRELALRFKTSYMTVGNALQQLVQEGLVTRTAGMGTFVRDPQTVTRGLVGIMTSCYDPIYMARLFGTMERELRKARYRPIVFGGSNVYQEELNALNEMGRFNEVGLILYSGFINRLVEDAEDLRRRRIPMVTINWPILDFDCSRVDHRQIGALQARHILEQGYRRILYIDTSDLRDNRYNQSMDNDISTGQVLPLPIWIEGLLATLFREGGDPPLIRIVSTHYPEGGSDPERDVLAKRQVREFTQQAFSESTDSAPDAIVVYGDRYLPAVVEVLRELKKEPGRDVHLVGADNQNLRGFPYVTVDECLDEIGHHAARLLLDRIEGRYTGPARIHVVAPKLVRYD